MSMNRGQGGMSERGQAGGEASLNSPNLSASEIAMYLKGVNFPADKQKLMQAAKQNGAPQNVISAIEGLSGGQFNSPVEVEQAFSGGGSRGGRS